MGITLVGDEAGEFLVNVGVDLGTVVEDIPDSGINTFVYIDEFVCNNCQIGGSGSTDPMDHPKYKHPMMKKYAGIYWWKHDGVNVDGYITLNPDGTMRQYHDFIENPTWYVNDNNEIVLEWPSPHVLSPGILLPDGYPR